MSDELDAAPSERRGCALAVLDRVMGAWFWKLAVLALAGYLIYRGVTEDRLLVWLKEVSGIWSR